MPAAQASLHEPAASSNNIKTSCVLITYRPSVLFDLIVGALASFIRFLLELGANASRRKRISEASAPTITDRPIERTNKKVLLDNMSRI